MRDDKVVVAPIAEPNQRYRPSAFEQQQREMQQEKKVIDFAGDIFASFIRGVQGQQHTSGGFKLLQVLSRSSNGKVIKVRFENGGTVYEDYVCRNSVLAQALDPHGKHNLNDPRNKQDKAMAKVVRREGRNRNKEIRSGKRKYKGSISGIERVRG